MGNDLGRSVMLAYWMKDGLFRILMSTQIGSDLRIEYYMDDPIELGTSMNTRDYATSPNIEYGPVTVSLHELPIRVSASSLQSPKARHLWFSYNSVSGIFPP